MPSYLPDILPIQESAIPQILNIQTDCRLAIWTEKQYQEEIERENSFVFGAKFKNRIIGFIAARLTVIPPITSETIKSATTELDILNFGVMKKHQKQGIGSLLLDSLLKNANPGKKVQTVWLEVRESNIDAINFYRKRGFVKTQIRKNFYRQPTENAVVMKLNIGN